MYPAGAKPRKTGERPYRYSTWGRAFAALILLAVPVFLLFNTAVAQGNSIDFDDLARRASRARESNDIPRALELYGQAIRLNPKWPEGWWFLGQMQYSTDSYAGARDSLTHYIDLTPNATAALALRGLSEFEIGEYSQSLADIQRSLSLGAANQPHNELILRFHEALLLTRLGRFEDAVQSYRYFARNGISSPEILGGLGLAGLRKPLFPKDVEVSQQSLFLAAGNAAFQFMAGNENTARESFQGLFQQFPSSSDAHYLYGYLLFPKDPDKAVAEFKRSVEIEPSNAVAQAMVAWSYLVRGNALEAAPYAERAVKENPRLPLAQLVSGRALVETGDVNGGIQHLQEALQLEPGNLEIHLALVRGYSEAGLNEDARRERQFCLEATKDEVNQVAR
jgi:tetratricopeptide (TPR) repeat protein